MVSKVSFSKDAGHGTIFETSPISKDYHSTINTSHRINLWDLLDNPLAFSHARPGDIALTSDVKNMFELSLGLQLRQFALPRSGYPGNSSTVPMYVLHYVCIYVFFFFT